MVQLGGFLKTFDPLGFISRSKNDNSVANSGKFNSEICKRIKECES